MGNSKTRQVNERFFEAYKEFDDMLSMLYGVEKDGVGHYIDKMKEAVTEVKEAIPEWEATFLRLNRIRSRYLSLKSNAGFDDFQGKDEDIVWIQVFCERLDAEADPLSKYAKMSFTYKERKKSLWQRILEAVKKAPSGK